MNARHSLLSLCAACAAMQATAEPLGRLFFTPEQRLLFDRQRQYGGAPGAESTLRLDGVAARDSERSTIWINGRPETDGGHRDIATLRVGESIDPVTRAKSDVVPHGSVTHSGAR